MLLTSVEEIRKQLEEEFDLGRKSTESERENALSASQSQFSLEKDLQELQLMFPEVESEKQQILSLSELQQQLEDI